MINTIDNKVRFGSRSADKNIYFSAGKDEQLVIDGYITQNLQSYGCYKSPASTTTLDIVLPPYPYDDIPINFVWAEMAAKDFSIDSPKLTYTGSSTKTFIVESTFSVKGVTDNTGYFLYLTIYKNGSKITNASSVTTIPNANRSRAMNILSVFDLTTNDYIEICARYSYVTNPVYSTLTLDEATIYISEL